ncbi:hypothetical protein D1AOALGA4SA_8234 [Olavius algarvensis Delta 1 endosymbiont]|nr:hypothetical protein D1AOALGA4SA_8234 [Olavius algarvensis Delta 1 endosymbiont]
MRIFTFMRPLYKLKEIEYLQSLNSSIPEFLNPRIPKSLNP